MERIKQHNNSRFLLSTFDGSPTCSARAWVEEIDFYLQHHQISENEAIKVAALHFGGKAYAWWIFESFSLKNERLIKKLVEMFDGKLSITHMVNINKQKHCM